MEQPAEHDPLIGQEIGNYRVTQKLGEGGMGSVYLAEHPAIGKKVAVKVLHAEFSSNQDVVGRFFNEARAVNDIQHPNIVDIVDYGVIEQGGGNTVYFIMEFLSGEGLTQLIRREAPLDPERALAICIQVADALAASHVKGIIHRDLKPDNIMLVQRRHVRDFPKVLDFGIAKLTGDQPGSRRTRTGIVMGTPAYMSPEQCEGKGNIDHRTDIYALGIVLYEMLTGQVPFTGEGYGEVLVQHLTQAPAKPSTIRAVIPPHVEAVVMKALEKRPDARFPNMEEMMKAMADPVGYVEAHGGLAAFHSTVLVPGQGPAPQVGIPTPSPIAPLTPSPGTLSAVTPVPGQLYQTPTTLSGGAGEVAGGAGRSRTGLIAAAAVAVLAIGGGAFFAFGRGGEPTAAVADEQTEQPQVPEQPEVPQPDPELAATEVDKPKEPVVEPPPEPPTPVLVSLRIESDPKGAEVFVGAEDKPRGKTPLTLEVPKSDELVSVTLKKSGYYEKTEDIVPNQDKLAFDWSLKRRRGSSSSSPSTKPTTTTKPNTGPGDLGGQLMQPSFGKKN